MVDITLDVTESHANRLDELRDGMEGVDVDAELANLVMESIDQTYRQEALK